MRGPRGDVTAVLDIAKCLYDAVSRLQRAAEKEEKEASAGGGADDVNLSMLAELGKGKGKKSKAAMQVRRRVYSNKVAPVCCFF